MKAAASWNMKEKLYEDLRDPAYGAAYINEALLEGDEVVFKTAVADVIRARGVGFATRPIESKPRSGPAR